MFTLIDPNVYVDIPLSGKVYVYFRMGDGNMTADVPLKFDEMPSVEVLTAAAQEYIDLMNSTPVEEGGV